MTDVVPPSEWFGTDTGEPANIQRFEVVAHYDPDACIGSPASGLEGVEPNHRIATGVEFPDGTVAIKDESDHVDFPSIEGMISDLRVGHIKPKESPVTDLTVEYIDP